MDPTEFWIAVISICGAVQCLFLACCFIWPSKGQVKTNPWPAYLMFFLAIRILKSIYYTFEGQTMSVTLMNIGFAAHIAAAVVLFLYFQSIYFGKAKKIWWHFSLPILILATSPWLTLAHFWYLGAYHLLLLISIFYWLLALQFYLKITKTNPAKLREDLRWLEILIVGTGIFFFVYVANYFFGLIPYALAPAIYSLTVFPIGIAAWHNFDRQSLKRSTLEKPKYQNISLSDQKIEKNKQAILRVLQEENAYLNPSFSLQELSSRTGIPPHTLSLILNQHLSTSFNQLINQHRIEAACRLLLQIDKQHYTIAAIAYEVGFNSLSVFNAQFKKLQGITPSSFRRQNPPYGSFSGTKIE